MKFKYGFAVAALAGLVFVGCGDDDKPSGTNNPDVNNTNNNTTDPNNTNNETTPNNTNNNTTVEPNNTTGPEPVPAPPKCGDEDEPARCQESADGFEWETASIINTFAIVEDLSCCFDYTGDGAPDNVLGELLGSLGDVNASIQEGIDSGSIALVLEHSGLSSLESGDFVINFWLGEWDGIEALAETGGNTVLIDPVSIDQGAQPQAYVPGATLADGTVTAGPGTIAITIDLLGTPLSVQISGARIEADAGTNSDLETGVQLDNGIIGGYVTGEDLSDAVNAYIKGSCECLGLGQTDLIEWDRATASADCAAIPEEGNTCEEGDTCGTIGSLCSSLFVLAAPDVDTDGDGLADALSIGAEFTAVGAQITGVAAAE